MCQGALYMKVLIVSDTHGKDENLIRVLEKVDGIDLMIHLGDLQGSEDYIEAVAPCPVVMVSGNNDFYSDLPREKVIRIGDTKVFLTHGHYLYVSSGTSRLKDMAAQNQCSIAMFGHTHKPLIDTEGTIWAINPGSLSYPRQEGKQCSYIIMNVSDNGKIEFSLEYLTD